MSALEGTNVALGVSGSIAAVRVVELAHELRRRGASVRAVCTDAASGIIHPDAIAYATDTPVVTELTGAVEHVTLCGSDGWADVYLVAPATANTIGKMAAAVDDTPVTTTATVAIGADTPVVVAPAMHEPMYDHPGVTAAIEQLRTWGVTVLDPRIEEGKAKIPAEETLVLATARAAGQRPLAGRHVVVTSGTTSEPIDPVRIITTRASGRTGRAVAKACYVRGATVTLVHDGPTVPYADVIHVETAAEMTAAVETACADADALVSAAAISDYTAAAAADEKLRSGRDDLSVDLDPTPKLLDIVREAHPELPIVGFKLETTDSEAALETAARDLIDRIGCHLVVANSANVIGAAETSVLLVSGDGSTSFQGSKADLGLRIADELAAAF